uniref:Uncharacterized protein n=1 Tax=Arundo donax TaxID=35708 RepID=A0A0A9HW05_ARUDO
MISSLHRHILFELVLLSL